MSADDQDPRIYFAAERTLLAWIRTALAVIGFGFLVARFGLFLRMIRHNDAELPQPPVVSSLIGIGFVLLGAFIIVASAWQHTRFCKALNSSQRPAKYWMSLGVSVSVMLTILSAALVSYLLASMWVR